jgi:hypothetical protein
LTPVANLPLVITTPAANFATSSAGIVDTGTPAANFATSSAGVVDTGGRFATGVNYTSGKFAPIYSVDDAGGKFAITVNNIGGKQWEQYQIVDNLK